MRFVGLDALARAFSPGERVYLPGAGGECPLFTTTLAEDPGLTRGLEITTSFVPGINRFPLDRLSPDVRVRTLFPLRGSEPAARTGRLQTLPVSYGGFVRDLRQGPQFDAVVVHVAPPDAQGNCSLGVSAEFTTLVAGRSRRVLAVVNAHMPRVARAPSIPSDRIELASEVAAALPVYDPGPPDAAAIAIARHVAGLIPNGAVLQLGLGKAPAAIGAALTTHRGLRFWSGMVSDGLAELAQAGALDPAASHTACAAVGSAQFYGSLDAFPGLVIEGCEVTHDAAQLAAQSPLFAVNSALEVDLFGQCNLEIAAGRAVRGAGGAPDFARAASKGPGASIVALPSTAGRDARSRILARLEGGVVTLARHEVDVVVTEHGAADLRGLGADDRARALIAVATPAAREDLARAWRDTVRAA